MSAHYFVFCGKVHLQYGGEKYGSILRGDFDRTDYFYSARS